MASESDPQAQRMNQLAEAFQIFNKTTEQLRLAYQQLEEQVAKLNQELEDTNRQLTQKVDELNQTRDYLSSTLDSMTDGLLTIAFSQIRLRPIVVDLGIFGV